MEVQTKLTRCPNGHYYNAALHQRCPVCAGAQQGYGAPAGNFPQTMAPNQASMQPPVAPPPMPAPAGNFPQTMAPGQANLTPPAPGYNAPNLNSGAPVNPFSVPTQIGGAQAEGEAAAEPVVGWLVCTEGALRGTDFRIHAGYNYIGRESGDIHIRGDQQVSRQNHAMVAFDSDDCLFYVGPASGRNLIRLNGKPVLTAVELHRNDVITIGSTKLLFIPLCGEDFRWTEETDNA